MNFDIVLKEELQSLAKHISKLSHISHWCIKRPN